MEPQIRIIPRSNDSRTGSLDSDFMYEDEPPNLHSEQFPPLPVTQTRTRQKEPTPTLPSQPYAKVAVHGYHQSCILEKLPLEVREIIWEAYMRLEHFIGENASHECSIGWTNGRMPMAYSNPRGRRDHMSDPRRPSFLPALCLNVSNSIREETTVVYIRNSTFTLRCHEDIEIFRKFLATVTNGINHVRALNFRYFVPKPCGLNYEVSWGMEFPDVGLALDCAALQTVHLDFMDFSGVYEDELSQRLIGGSTSPNLEIAGIINAAKNRLRMSKLLDCKKLRKMYIKNRKYTSLVDFLKVESYFVQWWLHEELKKIKREEILQVHLAYD